MYIYIIFYLSDTLKNRKLVNPDIIADIKMKSRRGKSSEKYSTHPLGDNIPVSPNFQKIIYLNFI